MSSFYIPQSVIQKTKLKFGDQLHGPSTASIVKYKAAQKLCTKDQFLAVLTMQGKKVWKTEYTKVIHDNWPDPNEKIKWGSLQKEHPDLSTKAIDAANQKVITQNGDNKLIVCRLWGLLW